MSYQAHGRESCGLVADYLRNTCGLPADATRPSPLNKYHYINCLETNPADETRPILLAFLAFYPVILYYIAHVALSARLSLFRFLALAKRNQPLRKNSSGERANGQSESWADS